MPPKSAQKSKDSSAENAKAKDSPAKQSPAKPSPAKKPKEVIVYNSLAPEPGPPTPIDVIFEGPSEQSTLQKSGAYKQVLKLEAPNAFSLAKTEMITEGPYEGYQVILLRPAKPLPFLALPDEARARIYSFYFASGGVVGKSIPLEGRRAHTKALYAKSYANGQKNRVGLLAVNRGIHAEAVQILYSHKLRLENTTALLDFIGQLPREVLSRLTSIYINTWVKTTSRNAMHFLADAPHITHLHIESSIFPECDTVKAAKYFYAEAYKFLEAVGAMKGDRTAGVDVLSFGKHAFTFKEDKGDPKPWAKEQVEEFRENLKAKLK